MGNFWRAVNKVILQSDILILVLDARMIDETRNVEIEDKVRNLGKGLVYAITKCDLADKDTLKRKDIVPNAFVSATKRYGLKILREKILIEAKRNGLKGKLTVGVLGYPNVGKSSLINALKGKAATGTSILSGYTRGIQKVKADNRITLIDTPGVIPYREKDEMKHSLIGTIDFTKSKDPDLVVMELMAKFPGKIETHYGVEIHEDPEETLEKITIKNKILKKGAIPDSVRMARMILKDWQKGSIR